MGMGNHYPPYESLTLTVSDKNSKGIGICFYQCSISENSDGIHCYCVHLLSIISKKSITSMEISVAMYVITFLFSFFCMHERGRLTLKGVKSANRKGR